jgi:hypothetical protein
MSGIRFTQYLMPGGREKAVDIDGLGADIEAKAKALTDRGYRLEIEMLSDMATINMEVVTADRDDCLAGRLCPNGPAVPVNVQAMIEEAYAKVTGQGGADGPSTGDHQQAAGGAGLVPAGDAGAQTDGCAPESEAA